MPAATGDRPDLADLLAGARRGDRGSLARLLTILERGGDEARVVDRLTHPLGGQGYAVGLTGAPGAGKSTLTGALVRRIRSGGDTVAVLAIDPSSPFTGGAILGDRVRMDDHATDPGVFIRSMATRGQGGGLSVTTPESMRALDACGWRWILVETVGVGQVELDVAGTTDTTVVVVNPGWGDAVQASKAGLLEIADVLVVNKADRPGADEARRDLERMLDLTAPATWRPPVVTTVATDGAGVDELWSAIAQHRDHLVATGGLAQRRAAQAEEELARLLGLLLLQRARSEAGERLTAMAAAVAAREVDPWTAAESLLDPPSS